MVVPGSKLPSWGNEGNHACRAPGILIMAGRLVAKHFVAHFVGRLRGKRPDKAGDKVEDKVGTAP